MADSILREAVVRSWQASGNDLRKVERGQQFEKESQLSAVVVLLLGIKVLQGNSKLNKPYNSPSTVLRRILNLQQRRSSLMCLRLIY